MQRCGLSAVVFPHISPTVVPVKPMFCKRQWWLAKRRSMAPPATVWSTHMWQPHSQGTATSARARCCKVPCPSAYATCTVLVRLLIHSSAVFRNLQRTGLASRLQRLPTALDNWNWQETLILAGYHLRSTPDDIYQPATSHSQSAWPDLSGRVRRSTTGPLPLVMGICVQCRLRRLCHGLACRACPISPRLVCGGGRA